MAGAHLITSVCKKPSITEHDFEFSITYKVDDKTKTIDGIYTSRFVGFGSEGIDPLERYYSGEHRVADKVLDSRCYTIDQKDGYDLYIVMLFNDSYLMGDTKNESYEPSLKPPHLEASNTEYQYSEDELPDVFDAEIVRWEYPEPIANTFVFSHFSDFHTMSSFVMLIVGILALILCIIFVKKGEDVTYNALDIISIVFNCLIFFLAMPIIFGAACLIQAYPTGPDWIYQAYLCIPPFIPFFLTTSVSLRRKGFRISGFCIQFLTIAVLIVIAIFEYAL